MELEAAWGPVRAVLSELSAGQIRKIVGAAGVEIHKITAYMDPRDKRSTFKQPFLQAMDQYMAQLDSSERDRVVIRIIEEICRAAPALQERLEQVLNPIGWTLRDGRPCPLRLRVPIVRDLPDAIKENLGRAISRYRDGDTAGAISSICGAVDSLTAAIYSDNPYLGNHMDHSYQERVTKSFQAYELLFRDYLKSHGVSQEESNRIANNLRSAVSNAAYVLASYRRTYADVHGNIDAPARMVQAAMDCAGFIVSNLIFLMELREARG